MGKAVNSVKSEVDVKRILKKYVSNWYLFVIALAIAFYFAQNKNKYIVPVYSLKTSVLIEDKSNSSVLQERGSISSSPLFLNSKLIDNQIALLKSFAQIKKIISKLDFEVSYFSKGEYTWTEIYKDSPFVVDFDGDHDQPRYQQINIKFVSPTEFELWSETVKAFAVPRKCSIGEIISSKKYFFSIRLKDDTDPKSLINNTYGFQINDINGLTGQYMGKTNVYIERNTSMLVIQTTGANKQKEKDYLNQLTKEFLQSNLDKKNQILTNTITFIERQLEQFGKELDQTEQEREDFRKLHQFMTIQEKIGSLLKNLDTESKDKKNLLIDLEYYTYLLNYVKDREDFENIVMPSSMGVNLPMFNALVGKLSISIQERNTLLANSTRQNPYIQILEKDIANMKVQLVESMRSTIETTQKKVENTDERLWNLNDEFQKLPSIERAYLMIERKFQIINDLYDFLLRRKSEVEIQRAANTPDHEIVDYAGDTGIMNIAPKPKAAYMNAIIWAILIPAVFLFLIVFLNNRIMALEDIVANTDVTVVGTIAHVNEPRLDGVLRAPSSYFTELLRIIRIKLGLDPEKGEQVVLVTSSVPEEGKTFFAINFAAVYALTGKRTVFLGFDFRNQTDLHEFQLDNSIGITSHLVNNFALDQVIQKTFTKNLDILLSGPLPPNPDELIESTKARNMFADLRKRYDYIVVDTPPIGLFGDAFLLNKFADISLFLVRHNFTRKRELVHAINDAQLNKLNSLSIVYNDANLKINARDIVVYGEEAPRQFFLIRWAIRARRIFIDLLRKI